MLLEKTAVAQTDQRELKVKIPTKLHIQLHAMKIMKGTSISETVAAALADYLHKNPVPEV